MSNKDAPARRVVLSIPENLDGHGRERIESPYYQTYLARVHETATVGEEWTEFTDIGCCGSQQYITLTVKAVEGGSRITEDTTFEFIEGKPEEREDPWAMQHDDPTPIQPDGS